MRKKAYTKIIKLEENQRGIERTEVAFKCSDLMKEGKAIIALSGDVFAGFTYIESWGNKQYVATSGLIVHPDFRGLGLAKRIKQASFQLARLRCRELKYSV